MIFLIALIVSLLFLPWPWNLVTVAIAAAADISLWVFGLGYSRRGRRWASRR